MGKQTIIRTIAERGYISAICEGLTDADRRWLSAQVKSGNFRVVMDRSFPRTVKTWAFA